MKAKQENSGLEIALPPLFTPSFFWLLGAQFLQGLGYASMMLLPVYLAFLGASRSEIGVVMGTAAVASLLSMPVVAWALDVLGRRLSLVLGTSLVALAMASIYFVRDVGPEIYGVRLVFGLGAGIIFPGYFAFASDIIPAHRRTEGFAVFGIAGLLPLMVNPVSARLGIDPAGLRTFYPWLGGLVLLSLVLMLRVPESSRKAAPRSVFSGDLLRELCRRRLAPVWLATVVFAGFFSVFAAFATVAAEQRGIGAARDIWLSYALAAVVVRLVGAKLPDKVGPSNIVAPALASYATAMLLLADASTEMSFLAAGAFAGLGHGYCFPVLSAQVVSRIPDSMRGGGLTTFTALWSFASLIAAPSFGKVADLMGDCVMFCLSALVAVVALLPWCALEHFWGKSEALEHEPEAGA